MLRYADEQSMWPASTMPVQALRLLCTILPIVVHGSKMLPSGLIEVGAPTACKNLASRCFLSKD